MSEYIDPRDGRTIGFTSAEFGNAWAVHRGAVFKTNDLTPFQREWTEWLAAHDADLTARLAAAEATIAEALGLMRDMHCGQEDHDDTLSILSAYRPVASHPGSGGD